MYVLLSPPSHDGAAYRASRLRKRGPFPGQESVLPWVTHLPILIFCTLDHRSAEQVTQFQVNHIPVGIQVASQDMMRSGAIGLVTFFEVTRFKDQVAVLNGGPDVLARIAIAPLKNQTIFVLVEASLTVNIVAIEHMQNFS